MRKSIFNSRKKLFSEKEGGIMFRDLICKDCGQVLHTAETPTHAICPNCGGKRMDIKLFTEEKTFSRMSLFSDNLSPLEENLKLYSGEQLSDEMFTKLFRGEEDYLLEKGFAEKSGNKVNISNDAFEMERLFSKLTISITKTLELDPEVMNSDCLEKRDIINHLEEEHRLPEKGIIIIKKAHGIPTEGCDRCFSDTDELSWIEDSSIIQDLDLEYNNQSLGLGQFIKIIKDRYPDAPENIMDILVDRGVIFINGSQVTIHKK